MHPPKREQQPYLLNLLKMNIEKSLKSFFNSCLHIAHQHDHMLVL